MSDGASLLDARAGFHFYSTGITPAMAKKIIGKGSKYTSTYLDAGRARTGRVIGRLLPSPSAALENRHLFKDGQDVVGVLSSKPKDSILLICCMSKV